MRSVMSFSVANLADWCPKDPDFGLMIRLMIGPACSPGEESFDLVVCTGGWLAKEAALSGPIDARHHLVVGSFEWPTIRAYLESRVEACEGSDWAEVARRLSRIGHWEFEDYRPAP